MDACSQCGAQFDNLGNFCSACGTPALQNSFSAEQTYHALESAKSLPANVKSEIETAYDAGGGNKLKDDFTALDRLHNELERVKAHSKSAGLSSATSQKPIEEAMNAYNEHAAAMLERVSAAEKGLKSAHLKSALVNHYKSVFAPPTGSGASSNLFVQQARIGDTARASKSGMLQDFASALQGKTPRNLNSATAKGMDQFVAHARRLSELEGKSLDTSVHELLVHSGLSDTQAEKYSSIAKSHEMGKAVLEEHLANIESKFGRSPSVIIAAAEEGKFVNRLKRAGRELFGLAPGRYRG